MMFCAEFIPLMWQRNRHGLLPRPLRLNSQVRYPLGWLLAVNVKCIGRQRTEAIGVDSGAD